MVRSIAVHAPWWAVSTGIHAVLVLAAMLVCLERAIGVEDDGIVIVATTPIFEYFPSVEPPRDVFERRGIPKDDAPLLKDDPGIFFPEAASTKHGEFADDGEDEPLKALQGASHPFRDDCGGFRGRQSSREPGPYDAMGVSSCGRGRYSWRTVTIV